MPLPSYVESKDEKVRETERVRQAVREIAAQREKVVQKMDELIEKTKVVTGRLKGGLRDI
jgi:hypothetical protein